MRKYLLISLLFWSNAYALEIEFYLDSDSYSDLPAGMIMKGEIVQGDYKKLVSVIKKHNRIPGSVLLSSRGGDVLEAIRIGRLMRKGLVTMVVLDLPANGLVNDARSATCERPAFWSSPAEWKDSVQSLLEYTDHIMTLRILRD